MDIVDDKLRWNHDDFVKVSVPKSYPDLHNEVDS
jgi:hypothetical protein